MSKDKKIVFSVGVDMASKTGQDVSIVMMGREIGKSKIVWEHMHQNCRCEPIGHFESVQQNFDKFGNPLSFEGVLKFENNEETEKLRKELLKALQRRQYTRYEHDITFKPLTQWQREMIYGKIIYDMNVAIEVASQSEFECVEGLLQGRYNAFWNGLSAGQKYMKERPFKFNEKVYIVYNRPGGNYMEIYPVSGAANQRLQCSDTSRMSFRTFDIIDAEFQTKHRGFSQGHNSDIFYHMLCDRSLVREIEGKQEINKKAHSKSIFSAFLDDTDEDLPRAAKFNPSDKSKSWHEKLLDKTAPPPAKPAPMTDANSPVKYIDMFSVAEVVNTTKTTSCTKLLKKLNIPKTGNQIKVIHNRPKIV